MDFCFELVVEYSAGETLAQRVQLHGSTSACEKAHGSLLELAVEHAAVRLLPSEFNFMQASVRVRK